MASCKSQPSPKPEPPKPEPPKHSLIEPEDVVDHYLCYTLLTAGFPGTKAILHDQFYPDRTTPNDIWDHTLLCNPVQKTVLPENPTVTERGAEVLGQARPRSAEVQERPLLHPDAHLVCYNMPDDFVEDKFKNLMFSNQLTWDDKERKRKELPFKVRQESKLCLPTGKKKLNDPEPPQIPTNMDHYKCYSGDGEGEAHTVWLVDQIFPEGKKFTLKEPKMICNPVEKIRKKKPAPGEKPKQDQDKKKPNPKAPQLVNGEVHLVCYPLEPPTFQQDTFRILNQFENAQITTRRAFWLCVPSTKRIVPPPK
jgi:hypothetical protein